MPVDETNRELENPEIHGWSRTLRQSPVVCPDLNARVQQRMVHARAVRRGSLAASALLVVVGLAWLWSPPTTAPMLAIEKTPPKTLPASAQRETETLAVPSPVARMSILDDQQAALWAGLEKLTEDL